MAEVQKFAGKLGQELRDQKEKMESDDIKYVLNMIISAVDLDKLEDEDIEDIGKKFDREEMPEIGGEEGVPSPEEEVPSPEEEAPMPPEEVPTGNEEMGEAMDKLESFINTPISDDEITEDDLSQYNDLSEEDNIMELDLEEIKDDINKSIGETLSKYFK
jgi:hypothetical protein